MPRKVIDKKKDRGNQLLLQEKRLDQKIAELEQQIRILQERKTQIVKEMVDYIFDK